MTTPAMIGRMTQGDDYEPNELDALILSMSIPADDA